MSIAVPGTLLERAERYAQLSHHRDVFVPVEDTPIFVLLVNEMASLAKEHGGEDLAIIVDSVTASEIGPVSEACRSAQRVYIFGDAPEELAASDNLISCSFYGIFSKDDQFFLAISSSLSLALVVSVRHEPDDDEIRHQGGWTGLRSFVRYLAEAVLSSSDAELPSNLPDAVDAEYGELASTCNFRLMSVLTHFYASKRRDVILAKSDLTSVLEILKAISAKRGAHDILYVFVEQIAQTVGIDRCSVVRVWAGEDKGHVLASHEDESIADLVIDLKKYPEITRSLRTRAKVLVNNVSKNPLTAPYAEELEKAGITAIFVIPIVLFDEQVGSFFLRAARRGGRFAQREVSFCEIVAEAAANALERAHLFESIQVANQRLEHLAITDGLTGLYNRRHFQERIEEEFERAMRYHLSLACMLIDVDDFKQINDTHGHLQGDRVLRALASRMLKAVRRSDIVARYGGEELVAIMPQTNLEGAKIQAERVFNKISGHQYEGMPEGEKVTVSIGVGIFDVEKTPTIEALIRITDEALYKAKAAGKNCVVMGE